MQAVKRTGTSNTGKGGMKLATQVRRAGKTSEGRRRKCGRRPWQEGRGWQNTSHTGRKRQREARGRKSDSRR